MSKARQGRKVTNLSGYVDVHTHLTHEKFEGDRDEVIRHAIEQGLQAIVVNGLEPISNRQILALASKYEEIKPALGIYPVDAVNDRLPKDLPFTVAPFDVWEEIAFIRESAKAGKIMAVGECGLDGHWLPEETFPYQEKVFEALLEIAMENELPVIIHTRKLEKRAMEILQAYGVKKVNFHCYGGKTKLAIQAASEYDWFFSIPANASVNQAFTKLLKSLPETNILTETDAPYLSPVRNTRNVPTNVIQTVNLLAGLRDWPVEKAKQVVWENFLRLFVA